MGCVQCTTVRDYNRKWLFVSLLFLMFVPIEIKWVVAPESSIPRVIFYHSVEQSEEIALILFIGVGYGRVKLLLVLHMLLSVLRSQKGSCMYWIPFCNPLHGFWRVAVHMWNRPGLKQFPLCWLS